MNIGEFLVDKDQIRKTCLQEVTAPELEPGQSLMRIESFALTANNISYAAIGHKLGYWHFFPSSENWGKVPAWGFAEVVESRCEEVAVGQRFYGYYPMASHLLVTPAKVKASGLTDGAAHRTELPAIYNEYNRVAPEFGFDPSLEARRAIFFPLFSTSFLLCDFLQEHNYWQAERVILGSASSKTALGLAHMLHNLPEPRPQVVGLTSPSNKDFVGGCGYYDEVVTYDQIESLATDSSWVFVDMSGNASVIQRLHSHLGEQLKYSCGVGLSHWEAARPADTGKEGRPKFFFAPSQAAKRREEWGGAELGKRIYTNYRAFALDSKSWMDLREGEGLASVPAIYEDVVEGRVPPSQGCIIRL